MIHVTFRTQQEWIMELSDGLVLKISQLDEKERFTFRSRGQLVYSHPS